MVAPKLALASLLLVLASPALAGDVPLRGTVIHRPVRLADCTADEGSCPERLLLEPSALTAVLERRGMAGRIVHARVRRVPTRPDAARLVSLEGSARGDVPALDGLGLGASSLRVRASTRLDVVDAATQRRPDGSPQAWLACRLPDGRTAWVLAEHVLIGTDSRVGIMAGKVLAPLFGLTSGLRGARTFHPSGEVYSATVTALVPADGALRPQARRLEGAALVRLGGGLWKTDPVTGDEPRLPDALSMAIRFHDRSRSGTQVGEGDQDLLVSAWSERFHHFFWRSLVKSDPHDMFANEYFPAVPFRCDEVASRLWLRVVPVGHPTAEGRNLRDRFEAIVSRGEAVFRIEAQRDGQEAWAPLALLRLERRRTDVDQAALRYHPDLVGRGLRAEGMVTAIRGAVYRASQDAREAAGEGSGMIEALPPGR